MYFVIFEAHPKPSSPEYGRVDGAFVSAFVNESVAEVAEDAVRQFIEDSGWDVAELDQFYPVERHIYAPGSVSLAHFDQAVIDGIVGSFNQWPVGSEDEDE